MFMSDTKSLIDLTDSLFSCEWQPLLALSLFKCNSETIRVPVRHNKHLCASKAHMNS